MNIKTNKQIPLLILFSLLTACSTQNTSGTSNQSTLGSQSSPGSQNRAGGQSSSTNQSSAGGQQSLPGSQLLNRQNKSCIDKKTGKAIAGCKPTKKVATGTTTKKTTTVPAKSTSMRKIVLNAPITSKVVSKPVVSRPSTYASDTSPTVPTRANTTSSFGRTTKPMPAFRPLTAIRPTTNPITRPVTRNATLTVPVTKAYSAGGVLNNPIRSAKTTPAPVVRPVVRPAPVKKPQNTLRRLTLNGSTTFKSGSSRLTSAGQTKLLVLALSLQEGNTQINRLLIEGHTDSVGNASMNQVLSLKRANAVAEYLSKKGGFARSMMETVGLGESKPVSSNKTRKGRALNRRVEITATGTRRINR